MRELLRYCYFMLILVSIGIGLINRKRLDLLFRILLVLITLGMSADIFGNIYLHFHQNNIAIFNFYIFFELWLIGSIAIQLFNLPVHRRLIILGLILCSVIDGVCIWRMGLNTFANWGYLCACILFTSVFLMAFIRLYSSNQVTQLTIQPKFWVCLSMVVYYGCNIPMFGILNYAIAHRPAIADKIYEINDYLNVIHYLFIAIAFIYQAKGHPKSTQLIPDDGQ